MKSSIVPLPTVKFCLGWKSVIRREQFAHLVGGELEEVEPPLFKRKKVNIGDNFPSLYGGRHSSPLFFHVRCLIASLPVLMLCLNCCWLTPSCCQCTIHDFLHALIIITCSKSLKFNMLTGLVCSFLHKRIKFYACWILQVCMFLMETDLPTRVNNTKSIYLISLKPVLVHESILDLLKT